MQKKIRAFVEQYEEFTDDNRPDPVKITVSCGVTTYSPNRNKQNDICRQLFTEASEAMKAAKKYRSEKNYVLHHNQISS